MTDRPPPHDQPPRNAGGELVIPVAAFAFTVYYFATIWHSPWTAQVNAVLVGALLFICLAVLAVRIARQRLSGAINFSFADLVSPPELLAKRLAFAALVLGYIIAIDYGGFTLTTFVFLAAAIMLLHGTGHWLRDTCLAAAMALIGYAVFVIAFETRFPEGPFEHLVKMVLA